MSETSVKALSPQTLSRFNDFIGHQIGLNFNENRWSELERGIGAAAVEFGFDTPYACIQWLMSTSSPLARRQIEILSTHLTIGETYFFREEDTLAILDNQVLPQLLQAADSRPRSLRIWSTACSTGEEPYSIAMLLDQKNKRYKDWDITILATDINIKALEKAKTGIYSQWSLRNTPGWVKSRYFTKKEQRFYEIQDHIKSMVRFQYLNLADDIFPSLLNNTNAMDIIFCRNVLMYFLPTKAETVVIGLYRSLVPNGWLIVSPTDSFHFLDREGFAKSSLHPCVFSKYEKNTEVFPPEGEPPNRFDSSRPSPVPITTLSSSPAGETEFPQGQAGEKGRDNTANDVFADALRLYARGNYPGAIERMQELFTNDGVISTHPPDPGRGDVYALMARSLANLGQLNEAALWCQKAAASEKLNPRYRYLQAIIFQEQGDEEAAIQSLKQCLYIDPDFPLAHFTLANLLSRHGNREEVRRHLHIAISLLESHGDEEVISPEEGLTAGRLREILKTTLTMMKGEIP